MVTPDDLRTVGYEVVEGSGTWTVTGFNRTWVFSADDEGTARRLYDVAVSLDNIDLRTQTEAALNTLDDALDRWDALTAAEFKAAMRLTTRMVVRLTRLTIRKHD